MAAAVSRTRSLVALSLLVALLSLRLLYAGWVFQSMDGSVVSGDDDVLRRLESSAFWQAPSLDAAFGALPLHRAMLGIVQRGFDDLLLAPAVYGSLALAALMVGLFMVCRALYRSPLLAAPLAILLVVFSPVCTSLFLSSHPLVSGLPLAVWAMAGVLSWRRSGRRGPLYAAAVLTTLACWTTIEAWLLLLPLWLAASFDAFRHAAERGLSRKGAVLVGVLGLTGILSWCAATAIAGDGPVEAFLQLFQPIPGTRKAGLIPALLALVSVAPVLLLGSFMAIAGAQVSEVPFRLGRSLLAALILVLVSVALQGVRGGERRIFAPLVLLAPLVAGGVTVAIRQAVDRPGRWMAFAWAVVLLQASLGMMAGSHLETSRREAVVLARTLRGLQTNQVVTGDQVIVVEVPLNLEYTANRSMDLVASYAQVYSDRVRRRVLMDSDRRALKPDELAKSLREELQNSRSPIAVAGVKATVDALLAAEYQVAGKCGQYTLLVHPRAEPMLAKVAAALRQVEAQESDTVVEEEPTEAQEDEPEGATSASD